jgi:hypothetical protein
MLGLKSYSSIRPTRLLSAALLLYQFFFFNILLPGHTRGAITLDGKHHSDEPACCCCGSNLSTPPANGQQSKQAPSQKDRENCAICSLAVRVMPTPLFAISLPPLTFLKTVDADPVWHAVSVDSIPTYLGRAPPAQV